MQPATVEGVADGAASDKPIDMVFNVSDGGGLTPYQVFSKINNYTGKRLKGYRIVVGVGTGTGFQSASALGIADKLHISLGRGEGWSSGSMGAPNGSDLFDGDGLATFSHGLFGAIDANFPANGFFDTRTAGFDVTQSCAVPPCSTTPNPFVGGPDLINSDTIESTTVLPSNYTTLFGDWLPSTWQPSGVFFDDDNDPNTDAVLQAWWNGSQWVSNNDGGFTPIPAATLEAWGNDPLYAVSHIEDVLNLGINYIVKVGDDLDNDAMTSRSTFTIRIIPVVADSQVAPTFLAAEPAPLVPPVTPPVTPPATVDQGGGCTAVPGNPPIDPMLPLLAALGLAGWGLRRRSRHS
ncbi:choice-of-anchor F family protein [Hydrogenophaga sp.]|uniref:choice-of-anchor F family protein n=1 Tax=Hydrogenophaga sp. TaxID=1904254 RepID=UPI0026284D68|nr:choice-of-anchor F family protein [Hydrogenophaga sp.]MDM7951549.1 choice-of-anchor F family protein [Hydrogenophaga sp.]